MGRNSLEKQIVDYVLKNKESLYRLAYSYVHNPDDALDIVQESICKAIYNMYSLKNPEYIKTWIYKIVVNSSLDLLKKRKQIVSLDDEALSGFELSEADNYKDVDLQKAVEDLPVQYRSIVVLRFFEDLKIEEIAAILGENVNTIKTRLYKSLKMLRIQFEGDKDGGTVNG